MKPEAPDRIGSYRLLEPLGRGGMGVVYRAEHTETAAAVAVKTVRLADAGLLQSLRREIHALSRIRHPGVVRIVDHGVDAGLPWYAMELLGGTTLRERLRVLANQGATTEVPERPSPTENGWWTDSLTSPGDGNERSERPLGALPGMDLEAVLTIGRRRSKGD